MKLLEKAKRLLKLKRKVIMIDSENRKSYYTTRDYPEHGMMSLQKDNRVHILPIESFSILGDIYTLETQKGIFFLKYLG